MSSTTDPALNRWPKQVRFILGNEAAERFSYYGMRGLLALYITHILLKSKDESTSIHHMFVFANYFMPLLGAWISDRYWGKYRTILWISLFYCAGHAVLACSDLTPSIELKTWGLYAGLALIAFGSGGIKPCVSAFMGDQFRPEQSHLLQKAYAAFYWSINLGSTASFLLIPWIRDKHGYGWAFGVPGLAMGFATFVFWLGTRHYVINPPARVTKSAGFFRVFWFAVQNRHRKPAGQKFWDVARARFSADEVDAARSVAPILMIFALCPVFWALFDQTFSTWVLQGEMMAPCFVGSYKVGPEQMLAANPVIVMIILPIMTLLVYPVLGRFATPLRRMSYGMFLSAVSFVIVAWLQVHVDQHWAWVSEQYRAAFAGGAAGPIYLELRPPPTLLWQVFPYVMITIAEVLFSTTGLEFAYREAAKSMKSLINSFWQLTVSVGNLFVTVITWIAGSMLGQGASHDVSVTPTIFLFYAGLTFAVAILFSVVAAFYRYRDPMAAQGK